MRGSSSAWRTISHDPEGQYKPEFAVNGFVEKADAWWSDVSPSSLQVGLERTCTVGRVEVFPYWDGDRYYQDTVEASTDGETWTTAVDMSKNAAIPTPKGFSGTFEPKEAWRLRINMLKNNINGGKHPVEFRAYEEGKWTPDAERDGRGNANASSSHVNPSEKGTEEFQLSCVSCASVRLTYEFCERLE